MSMPQVIIFHATNKCNASCSYCSMFMLRNKESCKELSKAEVEKISRSVRKAKLMIITGGEPFMREDLFDLIKAFYLNSSIVNFVITTNGICSDAIECFVNRLEKEKLKINLLVNFTLDGPESRHNEEKGSDNAFNRLLASYDIIKSSNINNLRAGVSITYSKENEGSVEWTVDFIENQLKPYAVSITLPRGEMQNQSASMDLNMDKYLWACEKVRKYNNFNALARLNGINFITGLNSMLDRAKRAAIYAMYNKIAVSPVKCCAGSRVIVMMSDGKIYPCELRREEVGDLRSENYDYFNIINSRRSMLVKEMIRRDRCACTHECFLGPSLCFDFISLIKILLWSRTRERR